MDAQTNPLTGKLRVLIAGGGVAALEALLALRELAADRVHVDLLDPKGEFAYKPLAVTAPFGQRTPTRYDLEQLAADLGAGLHIGSLDSVEPASHVVTTKQGEQLRYDVLLVAVGARMTVGIPDAVIVRGPGYTGRFSTVLRDLERRRVRHVAFAVPPGASWTLPLYELALMTGARVRERGLRKVKLSFITPESAPLELFGPTASAAVGELLEEHGVELHTNTYPARVTDDTLELVPDHGSVPAEHVVTLPTMHGPAIAGLPQDANGFIPVDLHGRVQGEDDVYAAGDATDFAIKQGGIATQQADAAAEAIAARAGADIEPQPFRPVLRGMLLTGAEPTYMRADATGAAGDNSQVAQASLWWPPAKIAGRYLSPFLALHHGEVERPEGGIDIEVPLHPAPTQGVRHRATADA